MVLIWGNRRYAGWNGCCWIDGGIVLVVLGQSAGSQLNLYYGAAPAFLSGSSRTIRSWDSFSLCPCSFTCNGIFARASSPSGFGTAFLVACLLSPVDALSLDCGQLLSHPGVEPLVALGPPVRLLVSLGRSRPALSAGRAQWVLEGLPSSRCCIRSLPGFTVICGPQGFWHWVGPCLFTARLAAGGGLRYFSTGIDVAESSPAA